MSGTRGSFSNIHGDISALRGFTLFFIAVFHSHSPMSRFPLLRSTLAFCAIFFFDFLWDIFYLLHYSRSFFLFYIFQEFLPPTLMTWILIQVIRYCSIQHFNFSSRIANFHHSLQFLIRGSNFSPRIEISHQGL